MKLFVKLNINAIQPALNGLKSVELSTEYILKESRYFKIFLHQCILHLHVQYNKTDFFSRLEDLK